MLSCINSVWYQAHSQDFTLGATEAACEGALFLNKVDDLFSRRPQNLSSPHISIGILESLRPNKASFSIKNPHSIDDCEHDSMFKALHPNKASLSRKKSTQSTIVPWLRLCLVLPEQYFSKPVIQPCDITVLTWNAYRRSNGIAANRSNRNQPRM